MVKRFRLNVNGRQREVSVDPDTPLLYVLRNRLHLKGPKFGCGLAQCGACTVLLDGTPTRSCVYPIAGVGSKPVVTVEGLPKRFAHAFTAEQAAQCGYCIPGMMVGAAECRRIPFASTTSKAPVATGTTAPTTRPRLQR